MTRREFLQASAASTAAAVAGSHLAAGTDAKNAPPFIDMRGVGGRTQNRSTVVSQHGMVCASQPLAAMAGIDILKAGGNCIDAAICTNAMLGLTEAAMCGIGGDLFAILWVEKDQKLYGLNASGRSPYNWSLKDALDMGLDEIPRQSPLSWSVPGCVSGWGMLNERFGKLPLADCLAAAIQHANEGFPLSPIISTYFRLTGKDPSMAKVYHPGGKVPQYGDIFKNPMLAKSYETIAKDGTAGYYEGWIAEKIVAKSNEMGGRMAMNDLKDHEANWVDPVSTNYRGWDLWEIPPNGQGIAALQMLNMLETFDMGSLEPNSAEHLHLLIEAKKLAYEDRAVYYADPEFADVPTEALISKAYGEERAKKIDPKRAAVNVEYGDPDLDSDTIYMTAADGEGNMISLIQSVYNAYGSQICPDDVGFHIQNRGQSYSLDEHHRNKLEPHKRPFHTIIPAFLTRDGRPVMSFGVMGGAFQPQGHVQVLMNMIDFGMSPQQAGDQARIEHNGSAEPTGGVMEDGGKVKFESGISAEVREQVEKMGHNVSTGNGNFGGYQAIWRMDDPLRYFGGSDPRKDGGALGY